MKHSKIKLRYFLWLSCVMALLGCATQTAHSVANFPNTRIHILRMHPGEDPKKSLEAFVAEHQLKAVAVVSVAGSLTMAALRYANQDKATISEGHFEIVSLGGVLGATSGTHLHMSVSDSNGRTFGGHLVEGGKVFTTVEVALAEVNDLELRRDLDPQTGYKELQMRSP